MKLFHLSDLHLGKRLNEYPLNEDQRFILQQILQMIDDEAPDAIMICGDVYDKTMPSVDAVSLFDDFLWDLTQRNVPVLIISGNHDSPERLAFGSRIMEQSQIHISRNYEVGMPPVSLEDEHGTVNFFLLPFVKPVHVRHALQKDFPEEAEAIKDYTDALEAAIAHMGVDESERNVLLAHQFVSGAERSESEVVNVGGTDNVDARVFDPFDYVALGHLHGPQKVNRPTVRYCGTPLKYSFSEADHKKSVTVVELGAKGDIELRYLPLKPLHDLRRVKGRYNDLMLRENYMGTNTEDYLHITLTDEDDVPNAVERLREVYHNLMLLSYDNKRTQASGQLISTEHMESLTPMELFAEFYEQRNNQPMDDVQREIMQKTIEKVWEEDS